MTKLIRFMSNREAETLVAGFTIENRLDHHAEHGSATNSVGFCFMKVDGRKPGRIQHTIRYLSGIVTNDIVLVSTLKSSPEHLFTKGYGYYSDYDSNDTGDVFPPRIVRTEYSATHYALHDFESWAFYKPTADGWLGSEIYQSVKLLKCNCKQGECIHEKTNL